MNIPGKQRANKPVKPTEADILNKLSGGDALPKEYIPAINVGNYIDANDNINPGNNNDTGLMGYYKQAVWDKLFPQDQADTAKIQPKTIMGNTASTGISVIRVDVLNQGNNYSNGAIATVNGAGATGVTLKPYIQAGKVVAIYVTSQGTVTGVPDVIISDSIGLGATAVARISNGGLIASSLIQPQINSFAAQLDPITGAYLGTEFAKLSDLTKISQIQNNRYFNDFDKLLLDYQQYKSISTNPFPRYLSDYTFPQAPTGTRSAAHIQEGAMVITSPDDNGNRIYSYDIDQNIYSQGSIDAPIGDQKVIKHNSVGVITLTPQFADASNNYLAIAFPYRKNVIEPGNTRTVTFKIKFPYNATYDNTKDFIFGLGNMNGSIYQPENSNPKIWFKIRMTKTYHSGADIGVGPYYTMEANQIICESHTQSNTIDFPNLVISSFNFQKLKIIITSLNVGGSIYQENYDFYVNDLLISSIINTTNLTTNQYLVPFFLTRGRNVATDQAVAIDYFEDIITFGKDR